MNSRAWREYPLSALCVVTSASVAVWNVVASFAVDHGWLSAGDPALDELVVRDVWSGHFPLVGSYSRFGWNHPGAWFMYLASVPYKLSGGGAWTLKLTAALVAAAALAWCVRAGWRLGSIGSIGSHGGAAVAAMSWLLFAWGDHGVTLRFVWNVDIAQMLFLAFLWWAALVLAGERGAGAQVVLLGTLLVHSYVGYLPLIAVMSAGLIGNAVMRRRRKRTADSGAIEGSSRSQPWAVVAVVVLWVPLVWDQFYGRHNLSKVAEYLGEDKGTSLTPVSKSLQLLSHQLDGQGPFFGAINHSGWTIPWVGVLTVALWMVVRGEVLGRLLRVGVWALGAAFVAIVLGRGELYEYRLLWLPVVGVFWIGLCLWVLVDALDRRGVSIARLPAFRTVVGMLVMLVGVDASVRLGRADTGQFAAHRSELARVLERVSTEVPDGRVTVGRSRSGGAHDLLAALRVAAEKAGQDWCDPLDEPWLAGEQRLCGKSRPVIGVYVAGPEDPVPEVKSGIRILHSDKGRVYLVPTADLVKIAILTG